MLEWRSKQDVYGKATTTETHLANYLYEDRAEPESKAQEELSQATQPMRTKPGTCLPSGRESFF